MGNHCFSKGFGLLGIYRVVVVHNISCSKVLKSTFFTDVPDRYVCLSSLEAFFGLVCGYHGVRKKH